MPFEASSARPGVSIREPLSDNADLAGRWDVAFTGGEGERVRAVAEFEQRFEQVTGTVILPTDDQRYLAGEVRDDELRLSRFDGGAAVLYEAKLDAQGPAGRARHGRTAAGCSASSRHAMPTRTSTPTRVATRLRNPEAGFEFAFRDLDGRDRSRPADPQFQGKVLLVTLAGSWCPNSHDEARLLAQLDRRYRARGLVVVEPDVRAARGVRARGRGRATVPGRQRPSTIPRLFAGRMDKGLASAAVPQLDGACGPTRRRCSSTGRAGVRKIHAGFAGPATARRATNCSSTEFEQTIEQLLAEPVAGRRR